MRLAEARLLLDHPFLRRQLIAYIGNKRRLLSLILDALYRCYDDIPRGLSFFDPFAGSGSVARLARLLGFRVTANDWEPYAAVLNRAYLCIDASRADALFAPTGGLGATIARLNGLPLPVPEREYIARHYAPAAEDPALADYRTERLFYTRANALALDKLRWGIEDLFPALAEASDPANGPRHLLLALLIYEAATHANTSGVFKACHKGFGGHSRDALKRIFGTVELETPSLVDGEMARVYSADANALVNEPGLGHFDVAYLDPPYNQHQYGSNYFMLNTLALWDRPPVSDARKADGRLAEKAGIRRDWRKTRSAYCSRKTAEGAFEELLDAVSADHILVSYSSDGLIPLDRLRALCERKGRVDAAVRAYAKYRGGRQSDARLVHTTEFVLIVSTRPSRTPGLPIEDLDRLLLLRRVGQALKARHDSERLGEVFEVRAGSDSGTNAGARTAYLFRSAGIPDLVLLRASDLSMEPDGDVSTLPSVALEDLASRLCRSACSGKEEELEELFRVIRREGGDRTRFLLLPHLLRKLAHRKHRARFERLFEKAKDLVRERPEAASIIGERLDALAILADKRFKL